MPAGPRVDMKTAAGSGFMEYLLLIGFPGK